MTRLVSTVPRAAVAAAVSRGWEVLDDRGRDDVVVYRLVGDARLVRLYFDELRELAGAP